MESRKVFTAAMSVAALAAGEQAVPTNSVAAPGENCVTVVNQTEIKDPTTGAVIGNTTVTQVSCTPETQPVVEPQPTNPSQSEAPVNNAPTTTETPAPSEPETEPSVSSRPRPQSRQKKHSSRPTSTTLPHTFVAYNQNHNGNKWGARIASSGCGPTVIAMVMASLTGNRNITPLTISKQITPKYYAYGSGTAPGAFGAIARHYGITERHARDFNDAMRVAKLGGLSIVHARRGHFTRAGHYMVLASYKDGKFRLSDPNNKPGRDSEKRGWTPNQLRKAGVDNIWTFQAAHR